MGKIGLDNSKLSDKFYINGFHSGKTHILSMCEHDIVKQLK